MKTKSQYYEINVENLKLLWHNAMIRGMIKARAKELLAKLPKIEEIVYKQCVRDAKSTVALAKCAVRVFDARDNAKTEAEEEAKRSRKTKPIVTITAQRKTFLEYNPEEAKDRGGYEKDMLPIYRTSTYRNVYRNPIRPQIRSKHYRSKKASKYIIAQKNSSSMESSVLEITSHLIPMIVKNRTRVKRKIEKDVNAVKPSLNLRQIAMKYIRKMLGQSTGTSNLKNLRIVHDHFRRTEKINNYFKHMNEENRRLYEQIALPIDSRTPEVVNSAQTAIEQVLEVVNSFAVGSSETVEGNCYSPALLPG
ncbi:hypothetical protein COOONC_03257 [Cooperia oncophora]